MVTDNRLTSSDDICVSSWFVKFTLYSTRNSQLKRKQYKSLELIRSELYDIVMDI